MTGLPFGNGDSLLTVEVWLPHVQNDSPESRESLVCPILSIDGRDSCLERRYRRDPEHQRKVCDFNKKCEVFCGSLVYGELWVPLLWVLPVVHFYFSIIPSQKPLLYPIPDCPNTRFLCLTRPLGHPSGVSNVGPKEIREKLSEQDKGTWLSHVKHPPSRSPPPGVNFAGFKSNTFRTTPSSKT